MVMHIPIGKVLLFIFKKPQFPISVKPLNMSTK